MFGVVWDYCSSKLQGKQYKQNTSPKGDKTEIKILANQALIYTCSYSRDEIITRQILRLSVE